MNINKYLKKLGIDFRLENGTFLFTMPDQTVKKVEQKELEQYLFIKLVEYIKSE